MAEPAHSQPSAPVSGVPSSCPSGPSASEMLLKLREFAQENPGVNRFVANPELVVERLHGHDGAEDTLPAAHINHNEHSVSPTPASAAGRDVSTPERSIENSSPTTELPPSTSNVAPTQPPASVTPLVWHADLQFRVLSTPQKTPHLYPRYAILEDLARVQNEIFRFRNAFFFFLFYPYYHTTLLALCDFLSDSESCILFSPYDS